MYQYALDFLWGSRIETGAKATETDGEEEAEEEEDIEEEETHEDEVHTLLCPLSCVLLLPSLFSVLSLSLNSLSISASAAGAISLPQCTR